MVSIERLRKAIELQKEFIIEEIVEKSEAGEKLTDDELEMLETYYDMKTETEEE